MRVCMQICVLRDALGCLSRRVLDCLSRRVCELARKEFKCLTGHTECGHVHTWTAAYPNGHVGSQGSRKNLGSHIDASHSRQPLVKGERLVRYEVNAVMHIYGSEKGSIFSG